MTLGEMIRARRLECHFSQGELARRAGLMQSRLSMLERPSNEGLTMKTLRRIAVALECDLAVSLTPRNSESKYVSELVGAESQLSGENTTEQSAPVTRDWIILTGKTVIPPKPSDCLIDA